MSHICIIARQPLVAGDVPRTPRLCSLHPRTHPAKAEGSRYRLCPWGTHHSHFLLHSGNLILRYASGKELYQGSYHKLVDLSPDVGKTCMLTESERMLKAESCQRLHCQQRLEGSSSISSISLWQNMLSPGDISALGVASSDGHGPIVPQSQRAPARVSHQDTLAIC